MFCVHLEEKKCSFLTLSQYLVCNIFHVGKETVKNNLCHFKS